MIFSIFCALTAGTAKVLSRSVNSKLSGKTGLLKSTFFNFVSGLLFSIILIVYFYILWSLPWEGSYFSYLYLRKEILANEDPARLL